MLFLLCELGEEQYAIDASRVVEVLPLVRVTPLPHSPPEVAGVFSFRGRPVPVIDLRRSVSGAHAQVRFSTRIILVEHPGQDGSSHLLGLIAERVTDTARHEAADFAPTGVSGPQTRYLSGVVNGPRGLVQRIDIERLLPESTRDMLFAAS